jgi:hypothetical protein
MVTQTIAGQPSVVTIAGHFSNLRWLGSVPTTAEAPPARRRLAAVVARAAARRAGPKYLALRHLRRCSGLRRRAAASRRGSSTPAPAGGVACVGRSLGPYVARPAREAPPHEPKNCTRAATAARRRHRRHRASLLQQRHPLPRHASPKSCTRALLLRGGSTAATAPRCLGSVILQCGAPARRAARTAAATTARRRHRRHRASLAKPHGRQAPSSVPGPCRFEHLAHVNTERLVRVARAQRRRCLYPTVRSKSAPPVLVRALRAHRRRRLHPTAYGSRSVRLLHRPRLD